LETRDTADLEVCATPGAYRLFAVTRHDVPKNGAARQVYCAGGG
jgi:hypothetical protein